MQTISIIVPVYKVEKYLARCVDSILGQSYKNFELVLVDDGSPDNCGKICDEYAKKDCRVKVVHKKNGGLGSARNAGMDRAKGDYYIFVDSDDWIESEYLCRGIPLIEKNYDCIISGYYIDFTGVNKTIKMKNPENKAFIGMDQTKELLTMLDSVGMFNTTCNKIYRAELIKKHNIRFEESVRSGEDLSFNAIYFSIARSYYMMTFLSYHYMREGEVTLTNKFDPDLYKNSNKLMNMRKELYEKLDMTEAAHKMLFGRLYMESMSSCVHNMYRQDAKFSAHNRVDFFQVLIDDTQVNEYVLYRDNYVGLTKLLCTLVKIGNPVLADITYSALFFAKSTFKNVYQHYRKGKLVKLQ